MKKNMLRTMMLLLLGVATSTSIRAQYGFGTNNPDVSSVMDMKSENKGVLFPRVSLTSTTVADPVISPAINMVVFNINSTVDPEKEYSATSVTPGLYSWNGTEWVRLLTTDGPVGVGVATPRKSAVLDVTSSTQGLLPPRMNNDQIAKIKDPVEGLLVFNTEQNCLMYYANATFRCSYADAASNQGAVVSSNAAPKYQVVVDGVVSNIGVVNAFASTSSPYAGFTATATPTSFNDDDGDDEATPLYQWYRYDNATGTEGKTPIGSASTYTITEDDGGKYIQASIQAVAATGTSPGAEQNASTVLGPVWTCGSSVSASYSNGDGISPLTEDKTIDYGITRIGNKCWITRNLGAETDPTLITDVTTATTGWYWQFGTKQGLSSNGTALSGWASYTAPSAWSPDSDPCRQSLGVAWHIPTWYEWRDLAVNDANYNTLTKGFNSALKIIPSGYFTNQTFREASGSRADYWSNEIYSNGDPIFAEFYSSNKVDNVIYTKALNLRCVHDIAAPAVVDGNAAPSFAKVENTAANLYPGGVATVVSVGYTDTDTDPAAAPLYRWYRYNDAAGTDGKTLITTTTPNYTFTAADEGKYIRAAAMAVATKGTLQGVEQDATTVLGPVWTCGTDISVIHPRHQDINDVTPSNVTADLPITYGIRREGTKCWITRNLGATGTPGSATDASAAVTGWHFQFNRARGYDNVNGKLSDTWDETIYSPVVTPWTSGTDPCRQSLGVSWHIPTDAEWQAIFNQYVGLIIAYDSNLKIAAGGYFMTQTTRDLVGEHAVYWTQGVSGSNGNYARFVVTTTTPALGNASRVYALPVRCVREIANASVVAGNAGPRFTSVINTGDPLYSGAVVTAVASGYQDDNSDPQNTTSTVYHWYRYDDAACTVGKVQIGSASTYTLTVADEGKYILASAQPVALTGTILGEEKYATTSLGPVWTCGSLVSATYLNGDGISPLAGTKTIDYGITRIGTKCWITKNLGAESQPTSKSDANIAAIGWYWQFGTKQGLSSNGSALSSWASYAAPTAWSPDSDPCRQSLGVAWHVPTRQELYDVFTTANYNSLTDAYNSALKIGAAGFFSEQNTKENAGTGYCWSSEKSSASNAHYVGLGDSYNMSNRPYEYAKSVRCVHDIAAPGVVPNNDAPFYNVSNVINTANKPYAGEVATVAVTSFQDKENDPAAAPLYKWYRYNDAACTQGKTFTGTTTSTYTITTADEGKYIRASVWAVATKGTLLGNEVFASTALGPIWSCENSVNMKWIEGDGVYPPGQPVSIDYGIVKIGNKCWITRNLGATSTPGSATDYSSVAVTGWYWQYNRPQAYAYNTTTKALSGWDASAFATTTTSWLPANDPCTKKLGSNWHIPTKAEWGDLQGLSNFNNLTNVYNGVLKIATAGYFTTQTARAYPDKRADYWINQNYNTTTGYFAEFNNISGSYKKVDNCVFKYALSVRCVYDIAAPK